MKALGLFAMESVEVTCDLSHLQLHDAPTGGNPIPSRSTIPVSSLPTNVYAEGISVSGGMRDAWVQTTPVGIDLPDRITATVLQAGLIRIIHFRFLSAAPGSPSSAECFHSDALAGRRPAYARRAGAEHGQVSLSPALCSTQISAVTKVSHSGCTSQTSVRFQSKCNPNLICFSCCLKNAQRKGSETLNGTFFTL